MSKAAEVLRQARDLWVAHPLLSGVFAEGPSGEDVEPNDKRACKWCALGAIAKAANTRGITAIHTPYSDCLRSAIAEIDNLEGTASITHWNDEGMLNVKHWDRAIELAESLD